MDLYDTSGASPKILHVPRMKSCVDYSFNSSIRIINLNPLCDFPTKSIFIFTVIDQANPWFTPRRILAKIIQFQLGANNSIIGTGIPKSQSNTNTFFLPHLSDKFLAKRFKTALTA